MGITPNTFSFVVLLFIVKFSVPLLVHKCMVSWNIVFEMDEGSQSLEQLAGEYAKRFGAH